MMRIDAAKPDGQTKADYAQSADIVRLFIQKPTIQPMKLTFSFLTGGSMRSASMRLQ